MWLKLRARQLNGFKFRRQHAIGPYITDFYCPEVKLVVEIDGDVHLLGDSPRKDRERDNYLMQQGITVTRYTNNEIHENTLGVMETLRTLTLALSLEREREK